MHVTFFDLARGMAEMGLLLSQQVHGALSGIRTDQSSDPTGNVRRKVW